MRKPLLLCLICAGAMAAAPTQDEKEVVAVAQHLFDAMATKDAAAARALALPDAHHVAINANGAVTVSPHEQFVTRMASSKNAWLERMWNPKVLIHGPLAVVWADYDFHLDGKFSHCGVDSFDMVKTPEGWKISAVSYTRETTACKESPLGKP
jgi:hypothetical protein